MTKELALILSLVSSVFAIIFFTVGLVTSNSQATLFGGLMLFWQIFWMYKIKSSK